jgi:WD40 repeat protein
MVLDGLSGPIAKMEWSTNNELIITASQTGLYGHVIVWKVETGEKLRQVEWNKQCNQRLGPLFVASFHTVNNNRVLYGGSILYSLNVSTGQSVQIMDAKVKQFHFDFNIKVSIF